MDAAAAQWQLARSIADFCLEHQHHKQHILKHVRTIRYPLCRVTDILSSLSMACCAFSDLLSCVGAFSCGCTGI